MSKISINFAKFLRKSSTQYEEITYSRYRFGCCRSDFG